MQNGFDLRYTVADFNVSGGEELLPRMRRHLHLCPDEVILVELAEPLPALEAPLGVVLERFMYEPSFPFVRFSALSFQNGVPKARVE